MRFLGIALFPLFILPYCSAAQTDLCWRDSFPLIPGQWARDGYVVEGGNRFRALKGATVELRSTTLSYEEAKRRVTRGEEIDSNLLKTATADADGKFTLGTVLPGRYEIRALMTGRELATAYIQSDIPPQWMGRGLRIALSQQGQGCSRIYAAGLDDTDCGPLDCTNLPVGTMKIVQSDGTPLGGQRLLFYRHSKLKPESPEFVLTTGGDGSATTTWAHGCYDIFVDHPGEIHLCFHNRLQGDVIVVLPPNFR